MIVAAALAALLEGLVWEKRVSRRGKNKTIYILKLIVLLLRFSFQLAIGLPMMAALAASLMGLVRVTMVSREEIGGSSIIANFAPLILISCSLLLHFSFSACQEAAKYSTLGIGSITGGSCVGQNGKWNKFLVILHTLYH